MKRRLTAVVMTLCMLSGCAGNNPTGTGNTEEALTPSVEETTTVKQLTVEDLNEYLVADSDLFGVYKLPIEWTDSICVLNKCDYSLRDLQLLEGGNKVQTFDCTTLTKLSKAEGTALSVAFDKYSLAEQLSLVPVHITEFGNGTNELTVTMQTEDYDCNFNYGEFVVLIEKFDEKAQGTYYTVESWVSPFVSGTAFDFKIEYLDGETVTGVLPICRAGFGYNNLEKAYDAEEWVTVTTEDAGTFNSGTLEGGTEVTYPVDNSVTYVTIENIKAGVTSPFNRYQVELKTAETTFYVPVGMYMGWQDYCDFSCTFNVQTETPNLVMQSITATVAGDWGVPVAIVPQRVGDKLCLDVYHTGLHTQNLAPVILDGDNRIESQKSAIEWTDKWVQNFVTATHSAYTWNISDIPEGALKIAIGGTVYTVLPVSDMEYPQTYTSSEFTL